jgi:prepilin-type N-terminal cleavage/methylation domain-containing protein
MRDKMFNKKGFSFVEMLIALSIGLLLLTAVFSIDLFAKRNYFVSSAFIEAHSGVRNAMDWIVRDIRWAKQIMPSKTIGSNTYTTGDHELILEVPSLDASGDIIDNAYDYIVYHINSTDRRKLERIVTANGPGRHNGTRVVTSCLNTTNSNTMNLSSGGMGLSSIGVLSTIKTVSVTLNTAKPNVQGGSSNESLKSIVELRNK